MCEYQQYCLRGEYRSQFASHCVSQEEVMLKTYQIGDSPDFYAQSVLQTLNKSIIATDLSDYEKLIFDKSNSTIRYLSRVQPNQTINR